MADLEKLVGLTITSIDCQKGADDGTGFVYLNAIGADETPDIDDEIFDYKTSKPYVEAWSENSAETTKSAGQAVSYGNVRAQHGAAGAQNAAGTICEPIDFNDSKKRVSLRIKVVDADAITKVQEGVYRGVSIKGRLVGKKWRDGKFYRYTVDPVEFSLVDKPANPNATITVVKADGSTEILKVADEKKTKHVGGKDLGPESFAYVGDKSKTETWKLPIHDASHVRNALARLDQTEGIPEGEKGKVEAKIRRAAKRFGIDAESLKEKAKGGFAGTGMGTVAQLAYLLDSLFYLRDTTLFEAEVEDDGSEIPKRIAELLSTAAEILEDLTSEEVEELIQMTEPAKKAATAEEIEKAAKSSFEKAKSAHEAMGDCIKAALASHEEHRHDKVKTQLEKMADHHSKMADHFKGNDGDADDAEKAAKKEETEEEKKAREKKEAEAQAKEKESEKSDSADQIKALSEQVKALTETVEKMASGKSNGRPTPVHPGAKVVSKADDNGGEPKDVIEKANAVKADDPERVDKIYRIQREAEPELVKL